ncbi:BMP family lipoprotein [Microbacterium sp. CPCC 204701]|uniref:BMP family lipoprotein n=1 Tax=Microbacterium sp. CPCC 204701 TaxID=2493084 RepID=UPI000FD7F2F0|nr:BMP family ABC transporter substrate-binding protein [Microbacterium sp. CPCC 204701]
MATPTRRRLGLVAAALLPLLALSACASDASDAAPASADDPYRALVITDGPENDRSWSNSVFDGISEIDVDNIEVEFAGGLVESADVVQQASSYASQGYDLILIMSGAVTAAATQIAEQFPDTTVCQGPWAATDEDLAALPDNQCVWNVKQQDGTFLAGALAGMVTQTNKISSVAGGDFPAVTRQPEGFILGARCVNPEVQIDIQYTGSFSDVGAAQAAATSQIAAGSDVILSAVDGAVTGLYGAARDAARPTYVIPSYFDNYESAPDVVLTSVLYNLNGITADIIEKGAAGEIGAHTYLPYDFANLNVGDLADFHGNVAVTPEIEQRLAEVEDMLRNGDIVVPEDLDDPSLSEKGTGSALDPASIGCTF